MQERTILVVDDDKTVHKFVSMVLGPRGFHIESAHDGLAGLARLAHLKPDMILVDFVMPRMNGFQFLNTLETKHLVPNTPVVLMSSLAAKVGERLLRMTRVRECVVKPFTAEEIVGVVQRHLGPTLTTPWSDERTLDVQEEVFDAGTTQRHPDWSAIAALREKVQTTLAEGFADRADDLVAAEGLSQLLAVLAEILEVQLDEAFMDELVELARNVR